MTKEIKDTILTALFSYQGDDYARAKAALQGLDGKTMNSQYSGSGKTRQQILDEYAAHDKKVKDAIDYVKSLTTTTHTYW